MDCYPPIQVMDQTLTVKESPLSERFERKIIIEQQQLNILNNFEHKSSQIEEAHLFQQIPFHLKELKPLQDASNGKTKIIPTKLKVEDDYLFFSFLELTEKKIRNFRFRVFCLQCGYSIYYRLSRSGL